MCIKYKIKYKITRAKNRDKNRICASRKWMRSLVKFRCVRRREIHAWREQQIITVPLINNIPFLTVPRYQRALRISGRAVVEPRDRISHGRLIPNWRGRRCCTTIEQPTGTTPSPETLGPVSLIFLARHPSRLTSTYSALPSPNRIWD